VTGVQTCALPIFHPDKIPDAGARVDLWRLFEQLARAGLAEPVATLMSRYRLVDLAFKAVGVGSVGVYCAIGLFVSEDGQPLALQIKEAAPSVLERFGQTAWPGAPGARVTAGQRVMQAASDIFLAHGVDAASGRGFYMRHLKTRRLGDLAELLRDEAFPRYAELCGSTLARAHARTSFPAVIAGYMGKGEAFDDALAGFALAYARRNAADFTAFRQASPSA
jgi:hypothetical protein